MEEINRHFTVSGIIISNNKVLLVWHNKLNTWLYPGGHIEKNELPEEALMREIKEETNLDVEIQSNKKINITTDIVKTLNMPYIIMEEIVGDKRKNHYHIDMVYLCKANTEEINLKKDEVNKYGWFSREEIEHMNLLDNLKILLLSII